MKSSQPKNHSASLLLWALGLLALAAGLVWIGRSDDRESSELARSVAEPAREPAELETPAVESNREEVGVAEQVAEEASAEPIARVAAVDPAATLLRIYFVFEDTREPVPGVGGELTLYLRDGSSREFGFEADDYGVVALADPGAPLAQLRVSVEDRIYSFELDSSDDLTVELPRPTRVSGQVLTSTGEGAAGAEVLVMTRSGVEVVRTSGAGRFSIARVPNEAELIARREDSICSKGFVLRTRKDAVDDLVLRLREGEVSTLSGRVTDTLGAGVAHAKLEFQPLESGVTLRRGWGGSPRVDKLVVYSDDSGRYSMPGIPRGRGRMSVQAPGFAAYGEVFEVRVTRELDVQLERGGTIAGRVIEAASEPGSATPVADALVVAWTYGGPFTTSTDTRTNPDGEFELRGIASGPVELYVSSRWRKKTIGVSLEPDEERTGVVVELEQIQIVEGVVTREDGLPLAGWMVGVGTRVGLWNANVRTDESGAFRLGLPYSDTLWRLEVIAPEFWQFELMQGPSRAEELGGRIVVPDDKLPSAFITGRVLLGDEALPGAVVGLRLEDSSGARGLPLRWAELDGSFRVGPLFAGRYSVELRGDGALKQSLGTIDIEADKTHDLGDVRLEPAASVRIELVGGSVPDGLRIEVYDPADKQRILLGAEAIGRLVEIAEIEPGDYTVVAKLRGQVLGEARFAATLAAEERVELRLSE